MAAAIAMIIPQAKAETDSTSKLPEELDASTALVLLRKSGLVVKTGGSNTRLNSQKSGFNPRKHVPPPKQPGNLAVMPDRSLLPENRLEVHIDWLQFAGEVEAGRLYSLLALVESFTNEELLLRPGKQTTIGYKEFRNSGRSHKSVRIGWDNQDGNGKCYCLISIPGKVLSAMKMRAVRDLALAIVMCGLHCTRLDIAVDDYGKRLKLMDMLTASEKKNYAKFRKPPRFVGSFDGAWAIYFGSRESARSAIVYNKEAESKGRIKAIRLEVRFGAKLAHEVLLQWLTIDPDEWGEQWEYQSANWLMRSAVGSIDFIDRENHPGEKNLSRIPRLDWWQEFIDLVDGDEIYHTALTIEPSLERTAKWHGRQVMRSLACVLTAFGEDAIDWFRNQIETAKTSLNERHMKLIKQFKKEYAEYKSNPVVEFG